VRLLHFETIEDMGQGLDPNSQKRRETIEGGRERIKKKTRGNVLLKPEFESSPG
jgi:hypothetical protein